MVPWYYELANSLILNKHVHITLLTFSHQQEEVIKKQKINGIEQIVIRTPSGWLDLVSLKSIRIARIKRYLKIISSEFDLIHIHGTEHQYQASTGELDIPVITSIQGILSEYKKVIPKLTKTWISWIIGAYYERQAVKNNTFFFCRTQWDKTFIREINSNAKIFHCWEMIRKEFFQVDLNPTQKHGIAFLGGSNLIKGYQELLLALNQVIDDLDQPILYIGGNVDEIKIRQFIIDHKLLKLHENNVQILGHLDLNEHLELFSKCRLLVHPTYIDNSPNTVCEAQIAGLPVLATNVGGVSSLIEHESTGYLVENDVKSIAKGLEELYNNKPLLDIIKIKGRQLAQKRHNEEDILDHTIDAYESILEKKN
jgi:glycosyltransferase involved in cell wall biosynthesis